MKRWCGVVALVGALITSAVGSAAAWADGDPASDVLPSQVSFLPSDGGFSAAQHAQLDDLLDAAARAGSPVRVAVIPNSYDLGSITVLWRKPETYARFLGAELSLVYKHPLIVVMPNGVGLNWPGRSTADAVRELGGLAVRPGPAGLVSTAVAAAHRLLATSHVHLAAGSQSAANSSASQRRAGGAQQLGSRTSDSRWLVIGLAGVALVGAGLMVTRTLRPRLRWLVSGVAVGSVALATPIAVVSLVRGGSAGAKPDHASPGTLFTLPEGRQRAPAFMLRDQDGRPVSPASFRGRNVLVTFVDPLCRNLCPLEAHVLNSLVESLPAARRPAIVAVSVDTWADSRRDLLQDFSKWHLVPQWHWAVGTHRQLASVWKRYAVEVQVVTKRLAGTTAHYITHSEATYLIDPAGYERAMFAWPFSAQDVLATLRRMSDTPPG
jgi:cytochrome oxidase Cu insertion factor (SCO1/SenC/PrrC family)